jgi:tetratricopeptide (TPR) repeat protein
MMWRMRVGFLVLILAGIAGGRMVAQETKAAALPPDPARTLAEAQSLYRKGSFDQALARYNDVLKADPGSGDAYAGIVRCYLKQDKVREADDALRKGLNTDPGNTDFKVAEGELLFRQGEIPEAGKLFDEVIAAPPAPLPSNPAAEAKPNARAYLGAARVAAASALYARQYILLKRAHEIDSSDPDIRKAWMRTLAGADSIKSLEDYLAQPTNDDAEAQSRLKERLDLLKASQSAHLGLCRPASDVTATLIGLLPVETRGGGTQGSGLNLTINGKKFKLLLDTGASGLLIDSKLAGQAGLKPVSDVQMTGIGDKPDFQAHIGYADSVRIGEMEFRSCPVYVVDRLPQGQDGIIGTDVFSQFLIEIDFPNSTLRLSQLPPRPGETPPKPFLKTSDEEPGQEPSPDPAGAPGASSAGASQSRSWTSRYQDRYIAPEMHSYVQAFRLDHMLLVPTKINDGPEKLFLLDTGSFDNTITPSAAQEVTRIHRAPALGVHRDLKKVYVADKVMLDFGHLRQTVPHMVSIDMTRTSRRAGTEISGTLGMVMLNLLKVRLDYRDALADFQYIPPKPRVR